MFVCVFERESEREKEKEIERKKERERERKREREKEKERERKLPFILEQVVQDGLMIIFLAICVHCSK